MFKDICLVLGWTIGMCNTVFFVAQNVQTIQQMQHSQPSPLKSEKNPLQKVEGEIVETLADFFQRSNASAPISNLNYLLNEFVRSNSFPEFEKDYVQDVAFMTSLTIDIISKLYELFEQREKIELEGYLCKSLRPQKHYAS